MTTEQWVFKATRFDLGTCVFHKRKVLIESRDQIDGARLWVIFMDGWVLRKDAEWEWEPFPSDRTHEFLSQTRFKTKEEAYDFWRYNVTSKKPLYL